MKVYNIWLFKKERESQVEIVEGFLTMREAKQYLYDLGFRWSNSQKKWEQTYITVDPFSDYEIDTVWTGAEIIGSIVKEEVGMEYVREVA